MLLFGKQGNSLDELLNRPRPSAWQQFMKQPCIFLACKLYTWQRQIAAQPVKDPVSVVCISDTHNCQPSLPEGDILIHAGDLTQSGSLKELQANIGLVTCTATCNEDTEDKPPSWGDIIYLQDSEVPITCNNGRLLKVYGSPYSPHHGNWAFQYPRCKVQLVRNFLRPATEAKCLLVNASIVGGLRDHERRQPVKLFI
ncbi:phosphoesterase [Aspergillus bombycis]|uniref:Phosphoesterase n=1 Tax=Aspergillus bombycis TaxID=109264 RepID=A0A1F8A710_9EURO|nr:phosphoesterase [Aspergillus bombycis]OGM47570.1 phosphoesterase [Aspergillus bombycis]